MTDTYDVTVNGARGGVYNGSGDQYNTSHHYYTADGSRRPKDADALRIGERERAATAALFVPPPHYFLAADQLRAPGGMVLVDGAPGSGRRTAALMLLHGLGTGGERFEEFSSLPEDRHDWNQREGDRFLLDLSALEDEEAFVSVQRRLRGYRSGQPEDGALPAEDAPLAVVLPAGMGHVLDPLLAPHLVRLGRPRWKAVLTRHLRMQGREFTPSQLAGPELESLGAKAPMRDLARLARLVGEARDSGRYGTLFDEWLGKAVRALSDREKEVQKQLEAVEEPEERALLLAAALFEGASVDAVFRAWRALLGQLGHGEGMTGGFTGPAFRAQLTKLGVERDGEGRVFFTELAHAPAVRACFWADFPEARAGLRDWVAQCPGIPGLAVQDRLRAVGRFAEEALNNGRPEDVWEVVQGWTTEQPSGERRQEAVTALEQGLSHPVHGGAFRRWVYFRSRSGDLRAELARVLTRVCRTTLASTHRDQALVRLHHLAARRGGDEVEEARTALLNLACARRSTYLLLLDRLCRPLSSGEPDAHRALLAELLEPARIPGPALPRRELGAAWRYLLGQGSAAEYAPTVTSWLSASEDDARMRSALELIPPAAGRSPAVLNRLYATAYTWASAAGRRAQRRPAAAKFWQLIDAEQGIAPAGRHEAKSGATR